MVPLQITEQRKNKMIPSLLKKVTPEIIVNVIENNPSLILPILSKLDTFKLFGDALSQEQQKIFSTNLPYLDEFLNTQDGKDYTAIFADAFEEFVVQKEPPKTMI